MTILRTFNLPVNGQPAEIEALISHTAYEILNATSKGSPVEMSDDDLEAFEAHVDNQIQTTQTEAYCFDSGRMERFTVVSHRSSVLAAINSGGYSLPHYCPQFTEVAEAWHIDREYREAVDSDQPRAAALAGFTHPQEWPNSSGHGLRRAA